MDKNNRPPKRETNVSGSGGSAFRRGSGQGGGPVGNRPAGNSSGHAGSGHSGYSGQTGNNQRGGSSRGRAGNSIGSAIAGMVIQEAVAEATGKRKSKKLLVIIVLVAIIALATGNFGNLLSLFGLGSGISDTHTLLNGYSGGSTNSWSITDEAGDSEGVLNTSVDSGARSKRTTILGKGKDQVTVMVYLCGTDLESKSGMASSDLKEMISADISDNVDVLVYTGGCANWKNSTISNRKNQIYQVTSKGIKLIAESSKSEPMTDPDTLASFIKWGKKNYPANRYELIMWDHGGGSISGYGYDELYKNGSMTLDKIGEALKKGGCQFDFIGFDACLMATLETALVVEPYADYLIASEETEPGVGWYYTNWLTELSDNPSKPTVEVGKKIVDDFVKMCGKQAAGQSTTLSVIDLAELAGTVPDSFQDFAESTTDMIRSGDKKQVINARANAKEFNKRNAIDQIDLVHFAKNLGTKEGKELANTLTNAIKYNKTSYDVANAYGISIYFPYSRTSNVNRMVNTYEKIGIDQQYTNCIRSFASLQVGGQAAAGGNTAQVGSLFEALMGGSSSSSNMTAQLIGALLQGRDLSNLGLTDKTAAFLDTDMIAENQEFLEDNTFDTSQLYWQDIKGHNALKLSEEQWDLVQNVELNVFADDGEGFIDLGLDTVYDFDDDGNLLGEYDQTWLAINDHFVAYYMLWASGNQDDYTIVGRVPAKLNGERVDLILSFTDEEPNGEVLGAQIVYKEDGTAPEAKGLIQIENGDRIDFLCDYYDYNKKYIDNFYLGDQLKVKGDLVITNKPLDNNYIATYRLTDIYQNHYWTPSF